MQRIVVVGTSCSGKTTLARRLAGRLVAPHIELDALYWLPGWKNRTDEDFRARVKTAITPDRWVVEGNYQRARDLVWPRATTVIWLNYSFPVVFGRALRRTITRSITGEELFAGNRESLRQSFLSRDSILLWVIQTHAGRRKRYRVLLDGTHFPHLHVIELRRPRDADALVAGAPESLESAG